MTNQFTTKRINHVAIVVDDIDEALWFWRDGLRLNVAHVEEVPDQSSIVAFLPTGESEIELVKATSDDSGVARFLKKRGPGIHHICLEVDDIEACIEHLTNHGVELINPVPILGTGGKRISFIHPKSAHGVLVELYELTLEESEIRLARERDFAQRALSQGQVIAAGLRSFLQNLREDTDTTPS